MRKTFLIATSLILTLSGAAWADVVTLPEAAPASGAAPAAAAPAVLPKKGEQMAAVIKRFGQPAKKYAPVGGGSKKTPPITRWDYDGFSVFFENSHVIDDVVPGNPPEVHHVEELAPAQ